MGGARIAAVFPYRCLNALLFFVGSQYADDGCWVATSWWGLHLRAYRVDSFLRYFSVSLNVTKSAVTGTAATNIAQLSPIRMWSAVKQAMLAVPVKPPDAPYKYLGIWLSATLDWGPQLSHLDATIRTRLLWLRSSIRAHLSLRPAKAYLSSAIWGAVAYGFGITPVAWPQLQQWDDLAASILTPACGFKRVGVSSRLFHPELLGGQDFPSSSSLWMECHATEWLVAIQSPGILGATTTAAMLIYQTI